MEIRYLEVLIMPQREVICMGQTLGWANLDLDKLKLANGEEGKLLTQQTLTTKTIEKDNEILALTEKIESLKDTILEYQENT